MTAISMKKFMKELMVSKSAITACGGTASQNLTASEARVPMTTYRSKLGTGLSVTSNGVKCNRAGWVLLSAEGYFTTGFTANDIVHLVIKLDSTNLVNTAYRIPSTYCYFNIAPQLRQVTAGTMIYLYAYNQTAARGVIANNTSTVLNVVYIA